VKKDKRLIQNSLLKCKSCGEFKDFDFFTKSTLEKAKLGNPCECKLCRKNYILEYRIKNKEKFKQYYLNYKNSGKSYAQKQAYYKKNKEILSIKRSAYSIKNKEKINEFQKSYRIKNRDKKIEYLKEWRLKNSKSYREKNKDKLNKYSRELRMKKYYSDENYRERAKKHNSEYIKKRIKRDPIYKLRVNLRCRIRNAIVLSGFKKTSKTKDILGADIPFVKKYLESKFKSGMSWGNRVEWHIDHIIPLSHAKTEKELLSLCHYTNLQPMWAKENISKSNKIPCVQLKMTI
jgi:hypothetical protein